MLTNESVQVTATSTINLVSNVNNNISKKIFSQPLVEHFTVKDNVTNTGILWAMKIINVKNFLKGIYLFNDSPAWRAEFKDLTSGTVFPKTFCLV